MRFYQILREYDREREIQRVGEKLLAAAERESVTDVNEIIDGLMAMDPTSSNQYTPWITNQYIKQQFRLEDRPRIKDVLEKFINAKSRLEKKDINQYDFRSLRDLMDQVYNVDITKPSTDTQVFEVPPNTDVLYNGPLGLLAVPKTKKASCEIGRGTKWCTASRENNRFTAYSSKGPLYVWRDKNGEKYQFWFSNQGEFEFMDDKDDPIEKAKLKYFRTQHPVLKKLFAEKVSSITTPKVAYNFARVIQDRFPEGERLILKNKDVLYDYIDRFVTERWPEAEPIIAKDSNLAALYAVKIIKGAWLPGEKAIARTGLASYNYATYAIKRRFPEGESKFNELEPDLAFSYANTFVKGRFPEGEDAIALNPKYALYYAKEVLKGRFPKGEQAIGSDEDYALDYAKNVLKGRFPKGETTLSYNPDYALDYAKNVLKGPFPQGEDSIAAGADTAYDYAVNVIKKRFPAGEESIMTGRTETQEIPNWKSLIIDYAKNIMNGSWPECEDYLISEVVETEGTSDQWELALSYAKDVKNNKWPEFEEALLERSPAWELYDYVRYVMKKRWPEAESDLQTDQKYWQKYKALLKKFEKEKVEK